MERHDTHLLSETEEEEEINDEKHKYYFNNSKNSSKDSENNSFYSNNSKKNSPFKIKNLNKNNDSQKNIGKEDLIKDNNSIISSKEIEDIFYNEKKVSIKKDSMKLKNKEENNLKLNESKEKIKRDLIEKEKNNIKNIKNISMDINKDNDKNITNIKNISIDINEDNKKNITNLKNKSIDINEDNKKNIEKKKIKMIKLDSFKEKNLNFLTYNPSLINNYKLKIEIRKRNCISLNNYWIKPNKIPKKIKNDILKKSVKSQKKKKIKLSSKHENNNICYNHLDEDEKKIKNLIEFLKKKKIKELKICKDSFSIKTTTVNPILLYLYKKNNNKNKDKVFTGFEIKNKIQHQNDFYLEKDTKYHNIKRINYFPSYKIQLNGRKEFQYIPQLKKQKDNYYLSSNMSNNSRYSNSNKKNNFFINSNKLKLKNDRKIKILYDLYCQNQNLSNKNFSRIKSAYSENENKCKENFYKKLNNINFLKKNFNYKNRNNINNESYKNNKNNWLYRLIKLKKVKNMYQYDKHFGNNESCPLCKEMDKKNEESIVKKGICPIISDNKKNDSKSSLYHRRIYSACTKYRNRNKNEYLN